MKLFALCHKPSGLCNKLTKKKASGCTKNTPLHFLRKWVFMLKNGEHISPKQCFNMCELRLRVSPRKWIEMTCYWWNKSVINILFAEN